MNTLVKKVFGSLFGTGGPLISYDERRKALLNNEMAENIFLIFYSEGKVNGMSGGSRGLDFEQLLNYLRNEHQ